MKQPVKLTDVINWSRWRTVGGTIVSIVCLLLSHYSHVSILTKTVADTTTNWNLATVELWAGIIFGVVAIIAGYTGTSGQEAVSLNAALPAKPDEEETVEVLMEKLEHRFRLDAANAVLKAGGTK